MSITLTQAATASLSKTTKQPSIVVVFSGVSTNFNSTPIYQFIKIGDGHFIGDGHLIGGRTPIPGQITAISFDQTTTSISYKLNPDLGNAEGVTSMTVKFIDTKALQVLQTLAANEFLGRTCRVLLAPDPNDTVFPDDYVTIFRGYVDDIGVSPGAITMSISAPDALKRQNLFVQGKGTIPAAIDAITTSITIDAGGSQLLPAVLGPDGATYDPGFYSYILVDHELIRYTGLTALGTTPQTYSLTGVVRGASTAAGGSTSAAAHSSGANFQSFYELTDNVITMALKIMLSRGDGLPFVSGLTATSVDAYGNLFFQSVDMQEIYWLTVGDYMYYSQTSGGSTVTSTQVIQAIVNNGFGTTITGQSVFTSASLVGATFAFRSKYDTYPDGLGMTPDLVDVTQHENLRTQFLSNYNYDIYIKDTIDSGKDFIATELYKPIACYSVPRKARSSVAYTVGPLPTDLITTLNTGNVLDPDKIVKHRSVGRNFYNTIIYQYNEDVLTETFLSGLITLNASSETQIPVGTKSFEVDSKGMRSIAIANDASTRRLNRYAFAADYITSVTVTFATGYRLEVADLVLLDGVSLRIADPVAGTATTALKFYEITSKSLDLKTGRVQLGLTNTAYSTTTHYGLIAPSSVIQSAVSASVFTIAPSFGAQYGINEYMKWTPLGQFTARVHSPDYSTSSTAVVNYFSGNTCYLKTPLAFTPTAGMVLDLSDYASQSAQTKLLYTFIAPLSDGSSGYVMI